MSNMLGSQRFQKITQLFLIVILLASSFAFLPQPAVAKGTGSKGSLTAKLDGRKVTVSGENFAKSHEFTVNAKSAKGNAAKLGTIKADSNGSFRNTYTLPDKFKIVKTLTVCVKDNRSNKRTCTTTK